MIKKFFTYIFPAAFLMFVSTGCEKDYASIEQEDAENVQAYIKNNNLTGSMTELIQKDAINNDIKTGIYYQVLSAGTGDIVDYTDRVFLTYTIKTLDGAYSSPNEFSNTYNNFLGYLSSDAPGFPRYPEAFRVSIKEVLKNKGGSIRLIIPSRLAYGINGSDPIPGNASLDCTLNLYDVSSQDGFDAALISKFARLNNLSLTKHLSGLYYQIITPGSGTEPVTSTSEVTTAYKLKYLDGQLIQEKSVSSPYKSKLSDNITGFQTGVALIKKGGKIRFFLPPALAAGLQGLNPNAILDYEVELLEVKN